MNKNKLKQLTFGFEIEGLFDTSINCEPGNFKHDGSVDTDISTPKGFNTYILDSEESDTCNRCDGEGYIDEVCECERELTCTQSHGHYNSCYHRNCTDDDSYHRVDCDDCGGDGTISQEEEVAGEYASPIYKDFQEMLVALSAFKSGKNHIHNQSCGLHLHIGLKNNHWRMLYNAMGNLAFLNKIKTEAAEWCNCQDTRLNYQKDMYYQFWKNPFDFINCFQGKQSVRNFEGGDSLKFRFMRFHKDYKTVEFRFLEPCKHKCANVKKLVSLLTDYLAEESHYYVEGKSAINTPEKETVEINLKASIFAPKKDIVQALKERPLKHTYYTPMELKDLEDIYRTNIINFPGGLT